MMMPQSPQLPAQLNPIRDFYEYAQRYMTEELTIFAIKCTADTIGKTDLNKIDVRRSAFEGCSFQGCCFDDATFIDVVFESCDFSNSTFKGAFFEKCRFSNCKGVGVNMRGSVIKRVVFQQSNFRYAFFDKTAITDVCLDCVDFSEVSMTEVKLKKFQATSSRFVKNNFHLTMLSGVDFSNNEFLAPTVSSPPVELKGVVVNPIQAADLMGLWGIVVKS